MNIHNVQFPLHLPTHPLKRAIKVALGRVLAWLRPRQMEQVRAGRLPPRLTALHRLLIAAHVADCERAGTPERLTPLQNWLWRGEQSVNFHAQAEARFQSWWMDCDSAITLPMTKLFADHPERFHTLCEIGCGHGLVLQDLATRFPALKTLIGLDMSAAQTERNRARFAGGDARLGFESGDALEWLPAHVGAGWMLFTNAGVLEYFPPAALEQLLRQLSARGPCAFALAEPVAADFDWRHATASMPFSAERTFSHPYPHLFRQAGWQVLFAEERQPSSRHLLLLAVCDVRSS